jgi:hypothetical protein
MSILATNGGLWGLLLCFGYQNIYNAQFMYNGRIMSKT